MLKSGEDVVGSENLKKLFRHDRSIAVWAAGSLALAIFLTVEASWASSARPGQGPKVSIQHVARPEPIRAEVVYRPEHPIGIPLPIFVDFLKKSPGDATGARVSVKSLPSGVTWVSGDQEKIFGGRIVSGKKLRHQFVIKPVQPGNHDLVIEVAFRNGSNEIVKTLRAPICSGASIERASALDWPGHCGSPSKRSVARQRR